MNYITPKKTKKSKYSSTNKTLPKNHKNSKRISRHSVEKSTKSKEKSQSLKKLLNNNKIEMNKICFGVNVILTEIISKNKFLPQYSDILQNQRKNIFNLKSQPKITISDFLNRIILYSKIEISTLILSLIYLNKILEKGLLLTEYNVHKLLCISILIAIKYNEDKISNNNYYAQIFGLSLKEMNNLENSYLNLIDYKLYIDQEFVKNFCNYIYEKIFVEFNI